VKLQGGDAHGAYRKVPPGYLLRNLISHATLRTKSISSMQLAETTYILPLYIP